LVCASFVVTPRHQGSRHEASALMLLCIPPMRTFAMPFPKSDVLALAFPG
jgi:hypothetical protein